MAVVLLLSLDAEAVITRLTPLREVLNSEQLIFTVKVEKIDAEKPAVMLRLENTLKGQVPFQKLPVNLTGDSEGQRDQHSAKLLKRLAKDLDLVMFASKRGKRYTAFGYTNGTWFQMIAQAEEDPAKVRWGLTHCEPYLRRTFKGTTETLKQVVQDGLANKKKPPEPDANEPPGLGPEIKEEKTKDKQAGGGLSSGLSTEYAGRLTQYSAPSTQYPVLSTQNPVLGTQYPVLNTQYSVLGTQHSVLSTRYPTSNNSPRPLFAVIPTFVIIGPIAVLAALFPAVFGGLALLMRRWLVLLTIASLDSTVFFLHAWFRGQLGDSGWGSQTALWSTMTIITLAGLVWSWRRNRLAALANPEAVLQAPQRSERILLGAVSITGLAVVLICLARGNLLAPPWKELLVIWCVAWVGSLYTLYLGQRLKRSATARQAPAGEAVMLSTLALACGAWSFATLPRQTDGTVRVVWTYRPSERGAFLSSPLIHGNTRVYIGAIHGSGLSSYGAVYRVDRTTGKEVWKFDDEGGMQQIFSTPCLEDEQLFIGEGLHENRGCRFFCLNAATGTEIWHFETKSHTESSPCVQNGRVFFGAGDDGLYCVDAAMGKQIWRFAEDLHIDANPLVVGDRLYCGSGTSRAYKGTEVFCLNVKTGKAHWRQKTDLPVWGSPATDGTRIYFGLGNGRMDRSAEPPETPAGAVVCFDPSGKEVWKFNVDDAVLVRPALDQRHIFFAARDRNCYCLNKLTGKLVWKKDLGSPVVAAPALLDNRVYVAASDGTVCCLHALEGTELWRFDVAAHAEARPQVYSSPAVLEVKDQDGTSRHRIYFGVALQDTLGSLAALYCLEAPGG
jgi:outer membrane protein assembly factor BamB